MKRWAILTVFLYFFILMLLTVPLLLVYGLRWTQGSIPQMEMSLADALDVYREWGYWIWVMVMVTGAALLLLVPLDLAERRSKARRRLLVPVITSAFLFANVLISAIFAVLCAGFGDKAGDTYSWMADATIHNPVANGALQQLGLGGNRDLLSAYYALGTIIFFWLVWGVLFYKLTRNDTPGDLVNRLTRWLLRGSILELLVAVPSHVIVRHRSDCCAPAGTFWGIVTGLSVMLVSFGPGVFFLFVARRQQLQARAAPPVIETS